MTNTFIIPADVAEHVRHIAAGMERAAQRLEHLHSVWGADNADQDMGDGEIWEWTVHIEHSEFERLIATLRNVAEFNEWLGKFGAPELAESEGAE